MRKRATECAHCYAELIITPAYPIKDRVVRCGDCGRMDFGFRRDTSNE